MARRHSEVPWLENRNGTWYVHWYDPDRQRTERMSLRTRDQTEAKARYITFLSGDRTPWHREITVADMLDQYLREHVGIDPDTGVELSGVDGIVDRKRQLASARHLKAAWPSTPLASIGIPASRQYRKAREPASPATVRRELNVLIAAAGHAVRWKRLDRSDMPQIELPPGMPPEETKFYAKAEVKALLAVAAKDPDPRLHAFILLAYITGARRKRVERLTRAQVRWEQRRLVLTPEGTRRTKKRAPTVPLTDEMAAEIRKLMLWSGNSPWLFRDPGYDVYHKFAAACIAIGAVDRTGPHVLRHSRATHMLQDGASLWEVAKLLGDTVDSVERVYGHHCPDYMAERSPFRDISGVLG